MNTWFVLMFSVALAAASVPAPFKDDGDDVELPPIQPKQLDIQPKDVGLTGCERKTRTIWIDDGSTAFWRFEGRPRKRCAVIFRASNPDSRLRLTCSGNTPFSSLQAIFEGSSLADFILGDNQNFQSILQSVFALVFSRTRRRFVSVSCLVAAIINGALPPTPAPTTAAPTTVAPIARCTCGLLNGSGQRIVGGTEANQHEFPYQVGLVFINRNRAYCGGTLISDKWVLTAAHCVDSNTRRNTRILVGGHTQNSIRHGTLVSINQVIIHSEYNENNFANDIALIELSTPIDLFDSDTRAHPACLPEATDGAFTGIDALATGWGTLSSGGSQPNTLQEVSVPTLSNDACRQFYGSYILPGMICAGTPGKDSCQGDSGGPLANIVSNQATVIGVTSFGSGCGGRYPGVYTRVSSYNDWIIQQTGGLNTCPANAQ